MSGSPRIKAEAVAHIHELDLLEKKIILATDGIMTKFSESTLRDKLDKSVAYIIYTRITKMCFFREYWKMEQLQMKIRIKLKLYLQRPIAFSKRI